MSHRFLALILFIAFPCSFPRAVTTRQPPSVPASNLTYDLESPVPNVTQVVDISTITISVRENLTRKLHKVSEGLAVNQSSIEDVQSAITDCSTLVVAHIQEMRKLNTRKRRSDYIANLLEYRLKTVICEVMEPMYREAAQLSIRRSIDSFEKEVLERSQYSKKEALRIDIIEALATSAKKDIAVESMTLKRSKYMPASC